MRSVGWHRTSGREKEGKRGKDGEVIGSKKLPPLLGTCFVRPYLKVEFKWKEK